MAVDPLYIRILNDILPDIHLPETSAFERHDAFIKAAFTAKAAYYRERTCSKEHDLSQLSKFGICLRALRILSKASPDTAALSKLVGSHPFLSSLINSVDDGAEAVELRAYANELIAKESFESRAASSSSARTPLPPQTRTLQQLKAILPSDRARLTGLSRGLAEDVTEDPQAMAEIAGSYWSGIWAARDKAPGATADYLKGYDKSLSGDPRCFPRAIDGLGFVDLINVTNNSCAGPDGVPFAVYRAAPLFYSSIAAGIFLALSEGASIPKGFNDGFLFLLPKKGTNLPDDTRPLSVTNAFNRIIASGVVSSITPALQTFL